MTGLRRSRLVRWGGRPDAPYRAVVFGLEEDMWKRFDAAYPEYEKTFAPKNVHLGELRGALSKRHTALIFFDKASKRHVDIATARLKVPIVYGSYAPIPQLEKAESDAVGFLLDTIGNWQNARRPTEIDVFLEHFNLSERAALMQDAAALAAHLQIAPATGSDRLIVADNTADQTILGQHASAAAGSATMKHFELHLDQPWYRPEIILQFLNSLQTCDTIIVRDSALGLVARLAGRSVIVIGRPFWAGYGLSNDILSFKRRRDLDADAMVAIIMLILSRYVDETGKVINPTDGWSFPSVSQPGSAER